MVSDRNREKIGVAAVMTKKNLRGEENKGVGGDENNFWGCLAGEMDFENHSYKY